MHSEMRQVGRAALTDLSGGIVTFVNHYVRPFNGKACPLATISRLPGTLFLINEFVVNGESS